MKNRLQKMMSLVITATILSISISAFATKDYEKHGAKAQIDLWIDRGVVTGDGNGNFNPDKPITRAEFAAILQRVFNYVESSKTRFTDVSDDKWYAVYISKAVAAGVLLGNNGKALPEQNITREQAVVMIYRAFNFKAQDNSYKKFSDKAEISEYAKEAISFLTGAGYINGRANNKFDPKENITKSEIVIILSRIVKEFYNKAGTYISEIGIEGNVVVNNPDIVLKDIVINGNIYITQGVGKGNVTLDSVIIKGKTILSTSAMNSIILKNTKIEITQAETVTTDGNNGSINGGNTGGATSGTTGGSATGGTTGSTTGGATGSTIGGTTGGVTPPPTVQAVTISNIKVILNGAAVDPSSLASAAGTAKFSGVRFTTNVGTSELHLTGFSSPLLGSLTADNKITFSSSTPEISISTLLGSSTTSRTDVLLDELRAMCGTSFTLSGVLKGTGSYSSYTSYASPITITIGKK